MWMSGSPGSLLPQLAPSVRTCREEGLDRKYWIYTGRHTPHPYVCTLPHVHAVCVITWGTYQQVGSLFRQRWCWMHVKKKKGLRCACGNGAWVGYKCVFPLILNHHTRHRPVEQSDRAAGNALTRVHEEASAHSEKLCWEPAKVRRPHLPQALSRLPFPRWLRAQQTQRWEYLNEVHHN